VHFDVITDLDGFFVPALADEFDGTQAANIPNRFAAVIIGHRNVVTDVRVFEPDFFDHTLDGAGVIGVEFSDVGMVREADIADRQRKDNCGNGGESFQWSGPWNAKKPA